MDLQIGIKGNSVTINNYRMNREFYKDSKLYKLAIEEKKEIDRLKWLESEKEKRDIGIDKAIIIWVSKHRSKWIISFINKIS